MIKVLFALLISLSVLVPTVYSETPQYFDVIMHNAADETGDGTMLNVHQANVVRVDVQITGTATVQFKIAGPGNFGPHLKLCQPSNSTTKVTETSASGVFYCAVAAGNVFVAPISAWTDGTVTVLGRATTGM